MKIRHSHSNQGLSYGRVSRQNLLLVVASVFFTHFVLAVAAAAKSFNVTYGKTAPPSAGEASEVFHTSYLYLMGRNGKFIDVFGYGAKPAAILAKLEEFL